MLWAVIFVSLTFMEVPTRFRDTVPLIIRSVFALFVHCPFSFVSASQRWVAHSVWLGQSVLYNSPLPSSKDPPFQNEAKCTTFFCENEFYLHENKNHFHIKGWALNLVLPVRSSARNQQVSMLLVKASLLKMRWDSKYKKGGFRSHLFKLAHRNLMCNHGCYINSGTNLLRLYHSDKRMITYLVC